MFLAWHTDVQGAVSWPTLGFGFLYASDDLEEKGFLI